MFFYLVWGKNKGPPADNGTAAWGEPSEPASGWGEAEETGPPTPGWGNTPPVAPSAMKTGKFFRYAGIFYVEH